VELIARLTAPEGEREERVRVRALAADGGHRWEVAVGERVHVVEAVHLPGPPGLWSLIVDGAQHEVAVTPAREAGEGADRYRVSTAAGRHEVEVADPLTHLARAAHGAAATGGARTVTAYMPGRVVAILVAEGDEVQAGQGVVVLEAMKMENEIAPDHAGRVTKIHVEQGQAVETGDPLFDLGPAED
jgi:biotin carboxyl carrier protein